MLSSKQARKALKNNAKRCLILQEMERFATITESAFSFFRG
jgi:hypothetical protein